MKLKVNKIKRKIYLENIKNKARIVPIQKNDFITNETYGIIDWQSFMLKAGDYV